MDQEIYTTLESSDDEEITTLSDVLLKEEDPIYIADKPLIALKSELLNKVDKITGKGLSTNDLTNELLSNYDTAYQNNHTHTNKSLLDSYNQSNSDIESAINVKHTQNTDNMLKSPDNNLEVLKTDNYGNITNKNEIYKGKEISQVGGFIFTQIANKNISNTNVETSIIGDGVGYKTIPANTLVVGRTYRFIGRGYISGINGTNTNIKIKLGSVNLIDSTSNIPATITNVMYEFDFIFTIRSIGTTGSIIGEGKTTICGGSGFSTSTTRQLLMTSPVTINTTIDNNIDITYTWGTASTSNSITSVNSFLEVIK